MTDLPTAIAALRKAFPGCKVTDEAISWNEEGPYVSGYFDEVRLDAEYTAEQIVALANWMMAERK